MSEQNKYYTLSAIAKEMANDMGIYSSHHYFQFLNWIMRGYREASMDFVGSIEAVMLQMNSLRIINLPSYAFDWVKIGIMDGERLHLMGRSGDMAIYNPSDDCGNLIPNAPRQLGMGPNGTNLGSYLKGYVGCGVDSYSGSGWSQRPGGGSFVQEGKYPDIRLRFGSEVSYQQNIYAEILTDGINVCGDTYAHPYLYEYLVAYGHWKRVSSNDDNSQVLKAEKKAEMKEQRKIAMMRLHGITPEELAVSLARGFKLTTKA